MIKIARRQPFGPASIRRLERLLPFLVAAVALVILNGSAWWVHRVSSEEIRGSFRSGLLGTAKMLAYRFESAYQDDYLRYAERIADEPTITVPPETPRWLFESGKQVLLHSVPDEKPLEAIHDLYLIDRRGALVATFYGDLEPNSDGQFDTRAWNLYPLFTGDEIREITTCLTSGEASGTAAVLRDGIYELTAYAAIRDLNQEPAGLIGVRANLLFADRLAQVRNRLLFAGLIGSFLVIVLTGMIYRILLGLDRAEAKLLHQERLAQLGQMVSVVAHEIRNPLGIIEQTSDLIRRRYAKDKKDDILDYIPEEVDRLNRIVSRFLEFARPETERSEVAREQCDLAAEVRKLHELLLPEAEERGLEFGFEVPESQLIKGLRPDAARQILLNLVLNAFDASESGGEVSLKLSDSEGRTRLVVSDQGSGMDHEQIQRATDPFYTTKEKGSGLGLALVAKLVEEASGSLQIESNPGHGTRIIILF